MKSIIKDKKKLIKLLIIIVLLLIVSIVGIVTITKISKYNNTINKIYVSRLPYTTEYEINGQFEIDGLIVHAIKKNGKVVTIDNDELIINGFDSSKGGLEQKIIVKYQNYQCSFMIKIKDEPQPTLLLVGIELETLPNKLTYKVGEWLDASGGVLIRKYNDGSESKIALINAYIYGFSNDVANTPGTYTLTVKYVEKGILAETTYTITIEE